MGQAYSTESPLIKQTTPLTTSQATTEASHVVNHLELSRKKALASLFLCATEEYKEMNKDVAEDEDFNNCDSILSSIAAARFTTSDAIDCFPKKEVPLVKSSSSSSSSSPNSSNPFFKLDKEKDFINGVPVGFLGIETSIIISPSAAHAQMFGDQRPLLNALSTGRVFFGPLNPWTFRSQERVVGTKDCKEQLLIHYLADKNDPESLLKLGLTTKKTSMQFAEYTEEIEFRAPSYAPKKTRFASSLLSVDQMHNAFFDEEPLAGYFHHHKLLNGDLFAACSVSTSLAAYALNILLCRFPDTNLKEGRTKIRVLTPSKIQIYKNSLQFSGTAMNRTTVSKREIMFREQAHAVQTSCALALPPSELLPLLPSCWDALPSQPPCWDAPPSQPPCWDALPRLTVEEEREHKTHLTKTQHAYYVQEFENKYWTRKDPDSIRENISIELILNRLIEVNSNNNNSTIYISSCCPTVEFLIYGKTENKDAFELFVKAELLRAISAKYTGPFEEPIKTKEEAIEIALRTLLARKLTKRFFLRPEGQLLSQIDQEHDDFLMLRNFSVIQNMIRIEKRKSHRVQQHKLDDVTMLTFAAHLRHLTSKTSSPSSSINNDHDDANHQKMLMSDDSYLFNNEKFNNIFAPSSIGDVDQNRNMVTTMVPVLSAFSDKNDGIPRLQQVIPEKLYHHYHLTLFRKEQRVQNGRPCFASPDVFLEKWQKFSQNVLQGYSSSNAWVFGGAVVACLDPLTDASSLPSSTNRDIDIAFPGLTALGVLREIQLLDAFLRKKFATTTATASSSSGDNDDSAAATTTATKNSPRFDMVTCATSTTLNFILPHPYPRIQVVLGRWSSIGELLQFTDIDASGVAFNLNYYSSSLMMNNTASPYDHEFNDDEGTSSGDEKRLRALERAVVCTPRSLHAWIFKLSTVSKQAHQIRGSPQYELRLVKYARRYGFAILHPDVRGPNGTNNKTYKKLKELENDQEKKREKIRMTLTSGLVWLYFVEQEKFKPKLSPPSILDVSSQRTLKDVQTQIIEEDYVESDGYGAEEQGYYLIASNTNSLFDPKTNNEADFLEKIVRSKLWRNNTQNGNNTTCEYSATRSEMQLGNGGGPNYAVRGASAVTVMRHVALFDLEIGHEHVVQTESWTVDIDDGDDGVMDDYDSNDSDYEFSDEDENNENGDK